MNESSPEVQRLGSIAFRFDEIEDRIRCIGVPAGVATGHVEMWLTHRLGFRFLESVHESRPDRDDTTAPKIDSGSVESMAEYGYVVDAARKETRKQVSRGVAAAKAPQRQASWLIRQFQLQKQDTRINLILVGEKEAAGFTLKPQEFLRVIDMLEDAFKKAGWALPEKSYSNLGSRLAQESGQQLN